MPKNGKYIDVIVQSTRIADELKRQMLVHELNYTQLSKLCAEHGVVINRSAISRYFSLKEGLSQRHVLFLCTMFGIIIKIDVMTEKVNKSTIRQKLKLKKEQWSKPF